MVSAPILKNVQNKAAIEAFGGTSISGLLLSPELESVANLESIDPSPSTMMLRG